MIKFQGCAMHAFEPVPWRFVMAFCCFFRCLLQKPTVQQKLLLWPARKSLTEQVGKPMGKWSCPFL